MKELTQTTDLTLFCDFHGHSRKENAFLYGCHCDAEPARRHHERVFPHLLGLQCAPFSFSDCAFKVQVGRSGPNLEPGTVPVYVTNGPRNGLNIGRKVGPLPWKPETVGVR